MLERLHQRGFDDFDAAHLSIFQYPGPQNRRPSELAASLGMSKQAVNYLLGQLERLGYLKRVPDPDDLRSKRVGEMETVWERRLGAKRFDQLRGLLVDLNQPAS